MKACLEKRKATVRISQERAKAIISSIGSEEPNADGITSRNKGRSRRGRPDDPSDSNRHTSDKDTSRNQAACTGDQASSSRVLN
jgi:hypothetical protein